MSDHSQVVNKEVAEVLPPANSETLRKLKVARDAMGTKAAIDSNSSFSMKPVVGSYILSKWRAERFIARSKGKR